MRIWRISSSLSKAEIIKKSKSLGFTPVSAKLANSKEELGLAHLLAKRSFRNKTNLAKVFELEFLLWLSGERDIRKALSKNDFHPSNFLLVSFKNPGKKKFLSALEAREKPLSLKPKANNLELEKISLGRLI